MSIEIKELIIKTTILNHPQNKEDEVIVDKQLIKDEILTELRQMVQSFLREPRER